jgi:4-amino-4-deoxy-L-arabinose transferase-like glycosyltransferase
MTSSDAEPLAAKTSATRPAGDSARAASLWVLAAFCSLPLVLELAAAAFGPYGYYIDEPYYLACARRLDWGYIDLPPLSVLVLRAITSVLGNSIIAIRLPAALAGAATAFVTGRLTRELGGGLFAELTAAACLMVGPGYVILFGFYSMNAFEVLAWASAAYVLMKALAAHARGEGTREFVLLGMLLGAAAQNKHTSVLYAGALALGLLLSGSRRVWLTRGPWLAVAACLLLLLPNLIWQGFHHWISLDFYRARGVNVDTPVLLGLANQALFINPAALPFCVLGLWWLLFTPAAAPHRVFAFAYLLLLGCLLALHSSRPDRIAGTYPVLLAAGAVVFERYTRTHARAWRSAIVALLLVGGAGLLPLALPILPPPAAARYAQTLGVVPRVEREAAPLPEWLAERLGWPELVAAIANVAQQLPPEERRRVVVLAASYDVAGAVELFGPLHGLRHVMSPHNSYLLWAGEHSSEPTDVVIAVGFAEATLRRHFRELRAAGERRCDVCLGDSQDVALFVVQEPLTPLSELPAALRRLK